MAGAIDISLSDLERKFGSRQVSLTFSDDGSGDPGVRLFDAISSARRIGDAVLLKAWSAEQIETLVSEDSAIRTEILKLVLAEGMLAHLEWEDPNGTRRALRKEALDALDLLVKAELRSRAEAIAGENPHATSIKVRTQRTPHTFVFAPSAAKPNRGGF